MLYLEDYLEVVEHLPIELKKRFTEMREMDLNVHNEMEAIEEKVKDFFSNAKKMKTDQRDIEFNKLKQEYEKTAEEAEEKVELANQIYDLVEKYLKRLDSELQKFKMELEADNSGITEILERRSLELDNPPNSNVNNVREKRKHSHNDSVQGVPNSARSGDTSCSGSNHGVPNNLNNWANQATFANSLSNLVNNSNTVPNGNPLLANSLTSPHSPSFYNLGAGSTAIAAAASQAIAATQQMQQGRRTASLKASYEAINAVGLQNISCDFNSIREGSIPSFNPQGTGPFAAAAAAAVAAAGGGVPVTVPGNLLPTGSVGEGSSTGMFKVTKRSRTSSQYQDTDESSETMTVDERGSTENWTCDPDEPRYCLCNQISYGSMVACDNEECQFEWFHYGCVGITQPPKGKWFCPPCTVQMKRKARKEKTQSTSFSSTSPVDTQTN
ncbi:inhibitor of growth protein 3-like [Panonychus citri]|uniref:inhibitor of growth protein 3-like n=1 Tax=Panonychus citri TaxID=50023 RepID=UPI002307CD8D|nr:inhibitor of growth protein 3-like [Panonychus citri]